MAHQSRRKLTPTRLRAVCEAVAPGLGWAEAADVAGICRDTLWRWRRERPDVTDALEKAQAIGVAARLRRIEAAAKQGAWQADAWWLERHLPDQWGRRTRLDVQQADPLEAQRMAQRYSAILVEAMDAIPEPWHWPVRQRIAARLQAVADEMDAQERGNQ